MMDNQSQVSQFTGQDTMVNTHVDIEDAALSKFELPLNPNDTMRDQFAWYAIKMYQKIEWTKATVLKYLAENSLLKHQNLSQL